MNKNHDCCNVLSKVFLALDGELSPEEEKEFLEEINRCSYCLEQYHIEQAFKKFLSQKITRRSTSSALISEIKEKIKSIVVE